MYIGIRITVTVESLFFGRRLLPTKSWHSLFHVVRVRLIPHQVWGNEMSKNGFSTNCQGMLGSSHDDGPRIELSLSCFESYVALLP